LAGHINAKFSEYGTGGVPKSGISVTISSTSSPALSGKV